MGPSSSSLYAPVLILPIPDRPAGKSAACQPKNLSSVRASAQFFVASSIISTTLSTCRSAGMRPADIDTESARYRRPDCVKVEIFALNLTRVVDCGGQRRKFRLFLYFEADRRREPAYVACRLPCPRKARSYGRFIPGEIRPVSVLPDIPHVLKIRPLAANNKLISASFAEINPPGSAWH